MLRINEKLKGVIANQGSRGSPGSGSWHVQGPSGVGLPVSGFPVPIAGRDSSLNVQVPSVQALGASGNLFGMRVFLDNAFGAVYLPASSASDGSSGASIVA